MENTTLFERLFKRNFSDGHNKNLLEHITSEHPYFSLAQFYLLLQTKEGSEPFAKQSAKTAVLFNNPHWLNFQLLKNRLPDEIKKGTFIPEIVQETFATENNANPDVEARVETEQGNPEISIPVQNTNTFVETPGFVESENTDNNDDEILVEKEIESPKPLFTLPGQNAVLLVEKADHDDPDNTDNNDDEALMEKEIEPMKPLLNISELTASPLPEGSLLFEPLHLVDYFASQGIKLSEEALTGDKLGKQLKSFTEWLKTMKKVHDPISGENILSTQKTGEQTDAAIQKLAEKSNNEGEVLTESMAEVFAKQGKTEKAIEVYLKLSLLDLSKIAYFAAKIEQLKGV